MILYHLSILLTRQGYNCIISNGIDKTIFLSIIELFPYGTEEEKMPERKKFNPKNIVTDAAAKRRHAIADAQSARVKSIAMDFHTRRFATSGPSSPPKGGNYGKRYRKARHRKERRRTALERGLDHVRRHPSPPYMMGDRDRRAREE